MESQGSGSLGLGLVPFGALSNFFDSAVLAIFDARSFHQVLLLLLPDLIGVAKGCKRLSVKDLELGYFGYGLASDLSDGGETLRSEGLFSRTLDAALLHLLERHLIR